MFSICEDHLGWGRVEDRLTMWIAMMVKDLPQQSLEVIDAQKRSLNKNECMVKRERSREEDLSHK